MSLVLKNEYAAMDKLYDEVLTKAIDDNFLQLLKKRSKKIAEQRLESYISRNPDKSFLSAPSAKREIYFLTISFYDDLTNIDLYLKCVDKFVSLEYIRDARYVYCYEQRSSEGEDFRGMHMHMVFDKKDGDNYKKSKLLPRIYNTFKAVCAKNCIDLKKYPDTFRDDKIEYMKGNKDDENKLNAVKHNKLFREKYNLKLLYNA